MLLRVGSRVETGVRPPSASSPARAITPPGACGALLRQPYARGGNCLGNGRAQYISHRQ
jgi:hypothetical protein